MQYSNGYTNKYVFSVSFAKELQKKEIYATFLRDAILPDPPPGAWVYRLSKEDSGQMEMICYVIIHEFIGIPGSLNCIQLGGNYDSPDADKIRTSISKALDALQSYVAGETSG